MKTIEHIGPSLWHGREVNSCTRCKYLRCQLVKSGRHPDYEYYCMHPDILASKGKQPEDSVFLKKVKERLPDRLEHFEKMLSDQREHRKQYGEFISNDSYTPETPGWCPVILATPPKPSTT